MTPTFHPRLVNGRLGDPALFVEMRHRRDALMFDLGDLSPLSARDLLRVGHVFVSHLHIDHFIGFDALLRVNIGRDKVIHIVGPVGLGERLQHKLKSYEWDLVDRYAADLIFQAMEIGSSGPVRADRFRFKTGFDAEQAAPPGPADAALNGEGFTVETELLEHHGPCLGFALREPAHANVWKNRLAQRGLAPGPWLQDLKRAVLKGAPDSTPIVPEGRGEAPLGELRDMVSVSKGQKLAYVTDVADTPANRAAIARLARDADILFIESRFARADHELASQRAHLTTAAAGEIARAARVRKVEPFHFSPRYEGDEQRMIAEVLGAFRSS